MRHLADRFERAPEGIELPVADTAAALGLGAREGNSSPLIRSLNRLKQFELAHVEDDETISVRRSLPPVHRRHVRRLPAPLQVEHEEWVASQRGAPLEIARRRARRVSLMLVAQGETIDNVERALHTAGFHPALAHEAVRWARDRQRELDDEPTIEIPEPPSPPAAA